MKEHLNQPFWPTYIEYSVEHSRFRMLVWRIIANRAHRAKFACAADETVGKPSRSRAEIDGQKVRQSKGRGKVPLEGECICWLCVFKVCCEQLKLRRGISEMDGSSGGSGFACAQSYVQHGKIYQTR